MNNNTFFNLGLTDRRSFMMFDTSVGGYDVLRNHYSQFKPSRKVSVMNVTLRLAHRPDLIAMEAYSNTDYWWLILMFNGIDDPFNDIYAGRQLIIPDKADVQDFWGRYSFTGKGRL